MANKTPALQDLAYLAQRLSGILSLAPDLEKWDSIEKATAEAQATKDAVTKAIAEARLELQAAQAKIDLAKGDVVTKLDAAQNKADAIIKSAQTTASQILADASNTKTKLLAEAQSAKDDIQSRIDQAKDTLKGFESKIAAAVEKHTTLTSFIDAVKAKF